MSQKRSILTLKQKVEIVQVHDQEKLSARGIAKRFNIGKTQAAAIIKNKTKLIEKWYSNTNISEKRSFLKSDGTNIDRQCFEWFTKARSKGTPVSGNINNVIVTNTSLTEFYCSRSFS